MATPLTLQSDFRKVVTDFEYFCKKIKLPQRTWHKPPNEAKVRSRPFKLAKHQKEFIQYLRSPINDKVVLKSRQKGFSTVTLAYFLWLVLYHKDQNILYMIHKEDKATEQLNMLRTLLQNLPEQYRPNYNITKNGTIKCRDTGSIMLVRTAGDGDAPRSGTYSAIVCDELAFYKEKSQHNIMSAISAASSNRIFISTPIIENDVYHNLVQTAEAQGTLFKHTHFDNAKEFFGSQKNAQLWYDAIAANLTPAQRAHELDCEFRGELDNRIWELEDHIFMPYNPNPYERVIVSLDLGFAPDPTAILYAAEFKGKLYIFAEDQYKKYTIAEIAQRIRHKGYNVRFAVMDSSGKKIDQTSGLSCYSVLRQELARPVKTKKLPDRIEMVRIANTALLKGLVKIDPVSCPFLVEALNNMTWQNGRIPKSKYKHISDALVYLVYNWSASSKVASRNVSLPNNIWLSI